MLIEIPLIILAGVAVEESVSLKCVADREDLDPERTGVDAGPSVLAGAIVKGFEKGYFGGARGVPER